MVGLNYERFLPRVKEEILKGNVGESRDESIMAS